MADLSIGSSGGTQSSTQSPQGLVGSGTSTESVGSVQPVGGNVQSETAATPSGIALHPTQLPEINVNSGSAPATKSYSTAVSIVKSKHHVNSGLLGVSAGLFVVAIIVFWVITRSAKNTTNYK